MLIEEVSFGHMSIAGRSYSKDLILLPDGRVVSPWIRQQGHLLIMADLAVLQQVDLRTLVVGTGIYGRLRIDPELEEALHERDIVLVAEKTEEAVSLYNQRYTPARSLAACFHLTC